VTIERSIENSTEEVGYIFDGEFLKDYMRVVVFSNRQKYQIELYAVGISPDTEA